MSEEKSDPYSIDFVWSVDSEKTVSFLFKEAFLRELNSTVKSLEQLRNLKVELEREKAKGA